MKAVKVILWIIAALLFVILVLYMINETNIFYSEPQSYSEVKLSELASVDLKPLYYLNNNNKAIMFIHGYSAAPKELHYFSDLANENGFDVITPILPGHGTTTEDFKNSYFSQWYNFARDEYIKYRKDYEHFFIAGMSMGGSITLKLAEDYNDKNSLKPSGIITMSTPVYLNNFFEEGVVYNIGLYFSRMLSWFTDEIETDYEPMPVDDEGEDGWNRGFAYTNIYPKQLHSMKMSLKVIKLNLNKITVPIFSAHAKGDMVVPYKNMFYIAKKVSSKIIKTKTYDLRKFNHSGHSICVYDSTRDDLFNEIMFFTKQIISGNSILN